MNKKYNVGQIVYLLSHKSLKIIPALVVEEITRKTVNDMSTQHIVQLPDDKKTCILVDELDAMLFNDVEELRQFMFDNSRKSINALIDRAIEQQSVLFEERSNQFNENEFPVLENNTENVNEDKEHVQITEESVIIQSGDKTTETQEGN